MSLTRFVFTIFLLAAPAVAIDAPISPPEILRRAERQRIEMVERVSPAVVCVFDANLRGGGSGVLIDEHGYGLTNYHVVAPLLDTRRGWGGLGDGVLYELEVLGVDLTGDVAMFRLIPPKEPYRFPYATLGDSSTVRVGDTAIAMGNPFILSEDYSPTVTLGIVTGVHRYQEGVDGKLAYTDCIQVDASINPGNSGGPLFNAAGEVIGINGRISVSTRGRFNVGFGYAISANQIRRFMPALRAGLLAFHGSWQALVEDAGDRGVVFSDVGKSGAAFGADIRVGDELLSLDGEVIRSANHVASLLGTYPARWPVLLELRRDGRIQPVEVRMDAVVPKMRNPFAVSADINQRQVKRLLTGFRRSAVPRGAAPPEKWSFKIERTHEATVGDDAKRVESFDVSWSGDGPVRMRQRFDDGTLGRIIEFDKRSATQRANESAEAFDLAVDERLILSSQYLLYRWAQTAVGKLNLSKVVHIGADAVIDDPFDECAHDEAHGLVERQVLEVIQWSLGADGTAIIAIDPDTFFVVRIIVLDDLAGTETTIDYGDYQDVGGLDWPTQVRVRGNGYAYVDTLSDWELSR